jgi:hypothetical protein
VDSEFNDAFAFFLNDVNIALLPDGNPVSVNNVNCGKVESDSSGDFNTNRTENFCQELFVDNTATDNDGVSSCVAKADTQLDGFTRPIFTNRNPSSDEWNRLKIVIADAADAFLHSAVVLAGNSMVCAPPDLTSPSTSAPLAPPSAPAPTRAPVQLVNAAPAETTINPQTASVETTNALANLVPGGTASLPAAQEALANVGGGAGSVFNVGSNAAQGGITAGANGIFPEGFLTGGTRNLRGEA